MTHVHRSVTGLAQRSGFRNVLFSTGFPYQSVPISSGTDFSPDIFDHVTPFFAPDRFFANFLLTNIFADKILTYQEDILLEEVRSSFLIGPLILLVG